MVQLVDILGFGNDLKPDVEAGGGSVRVADGDQVNGNDAEEVEGFGEGVLPEGVVPFCDIVGGEGLESMRLPFLRRMG